MTPTIGNKSRAARNSTSVYVEKHEGNSLRNDDEAHAKSKLDVTSDIAEIRHRHDASFKETVQKRKRGDAEVRLH